MYTCAPSPARFCLRFLCPSRSAHPPSHPRAAHTPAGLPIPRAASRLPVQARVGRDAFGGAACVFVLLLPCWLRSWTNHPFSPRLPVRSRALPAQAVFGSRACPLRASNGFFCALCTAGTLLWPDYVAYVFSHAFSIAVKNSSLWPDNLTYNLSFPFSISHAFAEDLSASNSYRPLLLLWPPVLLYGLLLCCKWNGHIMPSWNLSDSGITSSWSDGPT